jgi:hypothetical protein
MSYIEDNLEFGEEVVVRARIHWFAYIGAIFYCVLLFMPSRLSGLATTSLALTNKRLIGKTGMIMRKEIAVKFADIETARVQQGALIITAKGGIRIVFKGIANPRGLQQKIEEAIEIAVLGRRLPQFKD